MEPKAQNYRDLIAIDPHVMDGLPVLKGTRLPVYVILEMVEEGFSFTDIQKEYPSLTIEQIRAAVHYAAECVASTKIA